MTYAQNEIVCFCVNTSMNQLIVAPVMTDLNAAGGGDDYGKTPKGNLESPGAIFFGRRKSIVLISKPSW